MSRSVQDKGKFRENLNDKFYTHPQIASHCVQLVIRHLPMAQDAVWIEPSAGNGSFLRAIPSTITTIGLDIEPEEKDIVKQDYLEWSPPSSVTPYLVVGNPPFGRQSSLAKSFIKKSATFASAIAFILPKSFTKPSMYHAFDPTFHLIYTEDLPKDSFLVNDQPYDVPCVFQIWEKRQGLRQKEQKIEPVGFEYVKATDSYDMACRRVGVYAGRCFPPIEKGYSVQSHYFIRFTTKKEIDMEHIIAQMNDHTFPSNTVGPRSLSKSEINRVLNEMLL